jgi:bacteriocin-like protein
LYVIVAHGAAHTLAAGNEAEVFMAERHPETEKIKPGKKKQTTPDKASEISKAELSEDELKKVTGGGQKSWLVSNF